MGAKEDKRPLWKSAWAWFGVAVLLLGAVVDGAGFLDLVEPLVAGVADAARWLYPLWVVVALAVLLAVMVLVAVVLRRRDGASDATAAAANQRAADAERRATEAERRTDPQRFAHDTRILRVLRQVLPRNDIQYWADIDFGGKWHGTKTRQLMLLHEEHDSVEDRFLDPELERLRGELMSAVRELMKGTAKWGGPSRGAGPGLYDLGDLEEIGAFHKHHQESFRERWDKHREELGKRADRLVETYDAVMAEAQQRLPGAFDDVVS